MGDSFDNKQQSGIPKHTIKLDDHREERLRKLAEIQETGNWYLDTKMNNVNDERHKKTESNFPLSH